MPELALRCAQFFHSISKYCVGFYKNCKYPPIQINISNNPGKSNSSKNRRKIKQIKPAEAEQYAERTDMHNNIPNQLTSNLLKNH
jgi:hypothetical protein